MITKQKIKVFEEFKGDIDSWFRIGPRKEKALMTDEDWALISGFLQDINLVQKGLASKDFSEKLEKRLTANCDTESTITHLKLISDKM
jgi:hypothetical protein